MAPARLIVLNQLGNVYKMQGNLDEALEYYRQAVEMPVSLERV